MRKYLKTILKRLGVLHAFVGLRNQLLPRKNNLKNDEFNRKLFSEHLNATFGDQKGQVDFLLNKFFNYEMNGLRERGFFLDLAAADGITGSNTFFLERNLGWKGILFEPNPNNKASILKTRSSPLVTACVSDQAGKTVKFRIDNGQLGGDCW
jgi:hypothetical protein